MRKGRRTYLVVTALAIAVTSVTACGDSAVPVTTSLIGTTTTSLVQVEEDAQSPSTTVDSSYSTESISLEESTLIGVDAEAEVISIGLLVDQTGLFSSLESDIVVAQTVYWDELNASGGIDGWTIRYVIEDTRSDTYQHLEKYELLREEVAAIGLSTGSTANIEALDLYREDSMLVLPLSWYSGWAVDSVDAGVMLEQNTNYCIEAMNIIDFIYEMGGKTVALATFDDAYGRDASAGVRRAIEFYGMELLYDGTGAVTPGGDLTPVIQGIIEAEADWTFFATNPTIGAELLAGAVRFGYRGLFTGSVPSYDFRLLDLPVSHLYDSVYYQSAYSVGWGEETEGNMEMMEALSAVYPDRRPSDAYLSGWNSALLMHRVLAVAVANNDLTRSGIVSAANSISEVDYGGSVPLESYRGTSDDHVGRSLAIYKPDRDLYRSAGGADQTLSQEGGTTGSRIVKDFFVGSMAEQYRFMRPCYTE